MQNVLEFSNSRAVEYRAHEGKLVGYAAVFFSEDDPGTVFSPFEGHTEIIASTAFDEALGRGDEVFASFNHDADNILARTPDTLRLSVDKIGLKYEIQLAGTTIAETAQRSLRVGLKQFRPDFCLAEYADRRHLMRVTYDPKTRPRTNDNRGGGLHI